MDLLWRPTVTVGNADSAPTDRIEERMVRFRRVREEVDKRMKGTPDEAWIRAHTMVLEHLNTRARAAEESYREVVKRPYVTPEAAPRDAILRQLREYREMFYNVKMPI